jgi:hypothetical protein
MVNDTQKAINKQHEVFEPSFDGKECRTEKFTEQKLSYIHHAFSVTLQLQNLFEQIKVAYFKVLTPFSFEDL